MLLIYILLFYILIGSIIIKTALDSLEKNNELPMINDLTNDQYLFVIIIGSILWLPLFIHVFVLSIYSGELTEFLNKEESKEENKEKKDK